MEMGRKMSKKNIYATGTLIDPVSKTVLSNLKINKAYKELASLTISAAQSSEFLSWFGILIAANKKQIVRFKCAEQDHGTFPSVDKIDEFYYLTSFRGRATTKFNWRITIELSQVTDNFEIASFFGKRNRQLNAINKIRKTAHV